MCMITHVHRILIFWNANEKWQTWKAFLDVSVMFHNFYYHKDTVKDKCFTRSQKVSNLPVKLTAENSLRRQSNVRFGFVFLNSSNTSLGLLEMFEVLPFFFSKHLLLPSVWNRCPKRPGNFLGNACCHCQTDMMYILFTVYFKKQGRVLEKITLWILNHVCLLKKKG